MVFLLPMVLVVLVVVRYARGTTSDLSKLFFSQLDKGIFLCGVLFEEIEHIVLTSFLCSQLIGTAISL